MGSSMAKSMLQAGAACGCMCDRACGCACNEAQVMHKSQLTLSQKNMFNIAVGPAEGSQYESAELCHAWVSQTHAAAAEDTTATAPNAAAHTNAICSQNPPFCRLLPVLQLKP